VLAFEDDAPTSLRDFSPLAGAAAWSAPRPGVVAVARVATAAACGAAGSTAPAASVAPPDCTDGAASAGDGGSREPMTEDTTSAKTSILTLRSVRPAACAASARLFRADGNSAIVRSPAGDAKGESTSARLNRSDALPAAGDVTCPSSSKVSACPSSNVICASTCALDIGGVMAAACFASTRCRGSIDRTDKSAQSTALIHAVQVPPNPF